MSLRALLPALLAALVGEASWAASPEHVEFQGPQGILLGAELYRPAGPGPFPAVVAMHGCSGLYAGGGILGARQADWGERLSAAGFLVLLPDSYGSRGVGPQCRNRDRSIRPGRDRVLDAFAAKSYLQARPDVKADAVSMLGWSNGASAVVYAAGQGAGVSPTGRPDFARAVAFYPGCRVPFEQGWRGRIPMLILVGAEDDWTGAKPCEDLSAAARARGEDVDLVAYPGAYHDFDHPNLPVHVVKGLAFTIGGGGVAHSGTNRAAREDALKRVPAYLAR